MVAFVGTDAGRRRSASASGHRGRRLLRRAGGRIVRVAARDGRVLPTARARRRWSYRHLRAGRASRRDRVRPPGDTPGRGAGGDPARGRRRAADHRRRSRHRLRRGGCVRSRGRASLHRGRAAVAQRLDSRGGGAGRAAAGERAARSVVVGVSRTTAPRRARRRRPSASPTARAAARSGRRRRRTGRPADGAGLHAQRTHPPDGGVRNQPHDRARPHPAAGARHRAGPTWTVGDRAAHRGRLRADGSAGSQCRAGRGDGGGGGRRHRVRQARRSAGAERRCGGSAVRRSVARRIGRIRPVGVRHRRHPAARAQLADRLDPVDAALAGAGDLGAGRRPAGLHAGPDRDLRSGVDRLGRRESARRTGRGACHRAGSCCRADRCGLDLGRARRGDRRPAGAPHGSSRSPVTAPRSTERRCSGRLRGS